MFQLFGVVQMVKCFLLNYDLVILLFSYYYFLCGMHTINFRCSLENLLHRLTKCQDGDIFDLHSLNFSTLDCSQSQPCCQLYYTQDDTQSYSCSDSILVHAPRDTHRTQLQLQRCGTEAAFEGTSRTIAEKAWSLTA